MLYQIDDLTGSLALQQQNKKQNDIQQSQLKLQSLFSPSLRKDINFNFHPKPSKLSIDERIQLIKEIGEEVIGLNELPALFQRTKMPICYDGFEPSGRIHIAQGLLRVINVNKLVDAGCIFIFWVADWFALLNNKMGGDLQKIQNVGRYFVEVWKAAGMKLHNVKFLWASEEINQKPNEYWLRVMDVARKSSISRINRCSSIMGRKDDENNERPVAQLFYPCMQCTDIFFLEADICQLGMDQRKVNMLAREYVDQANDIKHKPIIVSHHMLSGLQKPKDGEGKMSKSNPDSAIFMDDSAAEVERKIKSAFCVEMEVEKNPILDYVKSIIFNFRKELQIVREEKHGGNKTYKSALEVEQDYSTGQLHPDDLKKSVAIVINQLLEPIRQHFKTDPDARQLMEEIQAYKVTK